MAGQRHQRDKFTEKEDYINEKDYLEKPVASLDSPTSIINKLLSVIWRRRLFIGIGTAATCIASLTVALIQTPVYSATATMVVLPPPFSTELKPPTLPVEAYETIAASMTVISKVKNRLLLESSSVDSIDVTDLSFDTGVQLSGRRNQGHLPLLSLTVGASSPKLAAKTANLWSEVLLHETADLTARGKEGTLEFIQTQFPQTAQELIQKENALRAKEDRYANALLEKETQRREDLLEYKVETETLLQEYRRETERLELAYSNETRLRTQEYLVETERQRLQLLDRLKPDLLEKELSLKAEKLSEFERELAGLDLKIRLLEERLKQFREQLEAQPQVIVLSKAITDEAAWESLMRTGSVDLASIAEDARMRTERLNPVRTRLAQQTAQAKVEFETESPKKEHLNTAIDRIRGEIDRLSASLTEARIGLTELEKQRKANLENLIAERDMELKLLREGRYAGLRNLEARRETGRLNLEARLSNEVDQLEREAETEIGRLRRQANSAKETYGIMADQYESSLLARAEATPDLTIGAPAVASEVPAYPRPLLYAAVALLAGFILTSGVAVTLEKMVSE